MVLSSIYTWVLDRLLAKLVRISCISNMYLISTVEPRTNSFVAP
jgi:hypothetical protein